MDKIIYNMIENQALTEFELFGHDMIQITKNILDSTEIALKNKDIHKLKKIAQKIPKKDIPTIWKMANNKFTDFKKNFDYAKRKLSNKKIIDEKNVVPIAMGTAVVASATQQSVDTIIKDVTENMKDKKHLIFMIPGSNFAIKALIFILVLAWIYVTKGAAIVTILKGLSIMMLIVGHILDGGITIFEKAFMESNANPNSNPDNPENPFFNSGP